MTYTYHIECPYSDKWNAFVKGRTLGYCQGYIDAMRGQRPGIHLRLVRSDGKVVDEVLAQDDVGIGQVAGWPTAQQYEAAAERALARARAIRAENNLNIKIK